MLVFAGRHECPQAIGAPAIAVPWCARGADVQDRVSTSGRVATTSRTQWLAGKKRGVPMVLVSKSEWLAGVVFGAQRPDSRDPPTSSDLP